MFHFHKWIEIYRPVKSIFEGIQISDKENTGYRYCKKCNAVQKFQYDSQGGSYFNLDKIRGEIILNKYVIK